MECAGAGAPRRMFPSGVCGDCSCLIFLGMWFFLLMYFLGSSRCVGVQIGSGSFVSRVSGAQHGASLEKSLSEDIRPRSSNIRPLTNPAPTDQSIVWSVNSFAELSVYSGSDNLIVGQ